jgi:hypothetical protein
MSDTGRIIVGCIFVGVVMGGAAWIAKPPEERTFLRFVEYFFSAIAASFVLGLIWYGIERWAGYS